VQRPVLYLGEINDASGRRGAGWSKASMKTAGVGQMAFFAWDRADSAPCAGLRIGVRSRIFNCAGRANGACGWLANFTGSWD